MTATIHEPPRTPAPTRAAVTQPVLPTRAEAAASVGAVKLRARDIVIRYGARVAVRDVSVDVAEHSVMAFIGPSGCGKSTILRCFDRMNDLIPGAKVEGRIELDGVDLLSSSVQTVELRRRVGMVFQRPNPFPMSIYENVAYGPEVILMDEPCSALDPIATLRIEELIRELRNDYTILIVTHNMQQAARVSDRTAFFTLGTDRAGYLVEEGETSQLFTSPRNQLTEDYVSGRFG